MNVFDAITQRRSHRGTFQERLIEIDDPEKLIEAVRKFACIWDVTLKCFKDSKAKENAWKSVAEEVMLKL